MLAEILLLRLEAALRTSHEFAPFTHSRFVPICRGMVFKRSRTRAVSYSASRSEASSSAGGGNSTA